MTRVHRIDLGRATRRGFLLVVLAVGLNVALGFQQYRDSGNPVTLVVWGLWAVAMLAGSVRFWRYELEVGHGHVAVRRLLWGFSVPFSEVSRLIAFRRIGGVAIRLGGKPSPDDVGGKYVLETREGRAFSFQVRPGREARSPELRKALDAVAAGTGLEWIGRDPAAEPRMGFWEFFALASGSERKPEVLAWVVGSCFGLRTEIAGVRGRGLRRVAGLYAASLAAVIFLAGFFPLMLEPSDFVARPAPRVGPTAATRYDLRVGFVAAAWAAGLLAVGTSVLGANVVLALVRIQRRGREQLETELAAAREVQQRLLPSASPTVPGLDLAGACLPAQDVGGDYYDYVPRHDGGYVVAVADVSGKGLHAGFLMTLTKGCLSTSLEGHDGLPEALSVVNRKIKESSPEKMFVTMALAGVGPRSRRVSLVRAGHNPPLLVRAGGETRFLAPPGIALGLTGGPAFATACREEAVDLAPGDVLVLYTDGVTEAMGPGAEEYGEERFRACVAGSRERGAATIRDAVLAELAAHRSGRPPNDDVTLVVLKAVAA